MNWLIAIVLIASMTGPFTVWKGHFLSYFFSIHQGASTAGRHTVDGIIAMIFFGLFVKLWKLIPREIAWNVQTAGNV